MSSMPKHPLDLTTSLAGHPSPYCSLSFPGGRNHLWLYAGVFATLPAIGAEMSVLIKLADDVNLWMDGWMDGWKHLEKRSPLLVLFAVLIVFGF